MQEPDFRQYLMGVNSMQVKEAAREAFNKIANIIKSRLPGTVRFATSARVGRILTWLQSSMPTVPYDPANPVINEFHSC